MQRLDGREVADYLKQRHAGQVARFKPVPRLAIVREGATPATDMFLRVKQRYGQEIGVPVDLYTESPETLMARIQLLNDDAGVTGINVELPLATAPQLSAEALQAVALPKDIEGLAPGSTFEVVTPKAILWLLAAYNIDVAGCTVVIVGQGKLVGEPLARRLEASGIKVIRLDDTAADMTQQVLQGDIVVAATGQPGLITAAMLKPGAIVVDAGAPASDLAPDVAGRTDITVTPNPGGVGPMTVAALFDNLLIAAQTVVD